jgi:hypothetical protein
MEHTAEERKTLDTLRSLLDAKHTEVDGIARWGTRLQGKRGSKGLARQIQMCEDRIIGIIEAAEALGFTYTEVTEKVTA